MNNRIDSLANARLSLGLTPVIIIHTIYDISVYSVKIRIILQKKVQPIVGPQHLEMSEPHVASE